MVVANTLAYYDLATITVVKVFIVQANIEIMKPSKDFIIPTALRKFIDTA
jgi:hypothetical protein